MGEFNISPEGFIVLVDLFCHSCQGYGFLTELPEFFRTDVSLGIKERIQHTNQCRSLSGEIMQLKQLETCKTGSTEGCFNFCLIAKSLQLP